ncbi:hypothetical protein D3C80_931170 [compost metagenome]
MPLFKLLFEENKPINWPLAGQAQPLAEMAGGAACPAAGVTGVACGSGAVTGTAVANGVRPALAAEGAGVTLDTCAPLSPKRITWPTRMV